MKQESYETTKKRVENLEKLCEVLIEQGYYAAVRYKDIQSLEGKMLTIIDALTEDITRRNALKSVIRQTIWLQWVNSLNRSDWEAPVGMPEEE